MIDLSQSKYRTKETATLNLKGPQGGKTDIEITVAGEDSDKYQDAFRRMRSETVKKVAAKEGEELSLQQQRELVGDFLAEITVEWKGLGYEGEELKCTTENAKMIYSDPELSWIRKQVDEFSRNRENYLGN